MNSAHLLNKWEVQVVWSTYAQVQHIHISGNGVVECIKEP